MKCYKGQQNLLTMSYNKDEGNIIFYVKTLLLRNKNNVIWCH